MLNVGFMTPRLRPEDVRDIAKCLTYMSEHKDEQNIFSASLSKYNDTVKSKAKEYWNQMVELGKIDVVKKCIEESRVKAERLVDVKTVKHTDARDVGAEWICLQAIRELEIDKFLQQHGWSESKINTTLAHLITRTVYTPSELKSMRIMEDNSAVCELISGSYEWQPSLRDIYKVAPSLYELKGELENRLTDYELADDMRTVTVQDSKKQSISLREVKREDGGDYYLEINSPGKAMKESSMNRKFKERFEMELTKAKDSLDKPRGKKTYEKVIERVGRAIGKYPSIAKYYVIEYEHDKDKPQNMKDIRWRIAIPENVDKNSGVYFLRTNVRNIDEETT